MDELGLILDWAASEGWNPGLDDAEAFHAADPDGFFIAEDRGEIAAAISVVNHNDQFAFLGLYIARPEYRGRGVGFGLWQHAITHAGERVIGLDGVPEQQENYAASGFVLAGRTTRNSGAVSAERSADIRVAETSDLQNLIAQEAQASGTRKDAYLSAWFQTTRNRTTLVAPTGFCTVRQCREGAKIGPLLANDTATASRLIRHAASLFTDHVTIDVPDASKELAEICNGFGMQAGFETARMYRGRPPKPDPALFAVTSLELG